MNRTLSERSGTMLDLATILKDSIYGDYSNGDPRIEAYKGVDINVKVNGETVLVREEGFVGRLKEDDQITVTVFTKDRWQLPFMAYAKKDAIKEGMGLKKLRDVIIESGQKVLTLLEPEEDGKLKYEWKIKVTFSERKVEESVERIPITKYPENRFYVLIQHPKGRISNLQISVVSRNGSFFLRTRMTFGGQLYVQDGRLWLPGFWSKTWQELLPLVEDQMLRRKVPVYTEYPGERIPSSPCPGQAVVEWFNDGMGFGMARCNPDDQVKHGFNGLAKVHFSGIKKGIGNRFISLPDMCLVTFEEVKMRPHTRGPDAGKQNKEAAELRKVRLIKLI